MSDTQTTSKAARAKAAAEQMQAQAAKARVKADEGVAKLGDLTHKNRTTIDTKVDSAQAWLNKKTKHQNTAQVQKLRNLVNKGLDALAGKRRAPQSDQIFDDAEM